MKQKKLRSLSAVLLIGWCLIFLRLSLIHI